jgi:poly(A) polymerase
MCPMQSDPNKERDHGDVPAEPDSLPVRRRGLIPRELLDEEAVFVVRRLQREGHEAYLVGGCVRDLLAGLEPKDFDLVTDARPNRIKRLFRSARVIGRRFRLVHIHFPGNHVIETATFRGDPGATTENEGEDEEAERDTAADSRGKKNGRPNWRDSAENIFGTAPEDARRRDFSINALFYDPVKDEVIDWVGGLEDMDKGIVRSIGDPYVRIKEDPVRMLRAVHFAERLDFQLEPGLETAIEEMAETLSEASQARLYIELVKMLTRGRAHGTFHRLHELGVLQVWLPELTRFLDEPVSWPQLGGGTHEEASQGEPVDAPQGHATWNLLGAADQWGLAAHKAPESLALAVLFGPWLRNAWRERAGGVRGRAPVGAFMDHLEDTFRPVASRMSIPRWACVQMRDLLWMLDNFRVPPPQKQLHRMMRRPGFALGLAFYRLDLLARDGSRETFDYWKEKAGQDDIGLSIERPPPGARGRPSGRATRKGSSRRGGGRKAASRGGRGGRRRAAGGPPPPSEGKRFDPNEPEAGAWSPPPPPA